jgi:hypothetical protein
METATIIGIDLAKRVFQVHGAAADGSVVFRKKLPRGQLLTFLGRQPSCIIAMEAGATAHHWGREIAKLGHTVRLVPPIYVKPFVKRQKNDASDAEAMTEAASRPSMRFVAVKTEGQQAGIEPSVGSVGDSYDNALAETVIGLFKTEVIHRRGPWRSLEAVELATLQWVDWFNNRRLLEPIGNIPPAEAETRFYAQSQEIAMVA